VDIERIIWIASLIGAILVAMLRKGGGRFGLLICLYGGFMYGFLSMAAQGGFEANYIVIILIINAVAVATGLIWLLASRAGKKKPPATAVLLLAVALAAGWYTLPLADQALPDWDIAAWLPSSQKGVAGDDLAVHYIDVGQGDSILIQTASKNMLIDAGPRSAGERVVEYLQGQGVEKLDLVISTHAHEDHIGGMVDVFTAFTVDEVLDPGVVHTSKTFENYLDAIEDEGITFTVAEAGMSRDLGDGIKMDILHPTNPSSSDLNASSVVTRLSYSDVAFVFTGDAESGDEKEILEHGFTLRADVLKVGHHGSATSSSSDFLNKVRPTYAVITVGEGNTYFHPHQETLDRFEAANVQVFRSDLHGDIVFITDGIEIEVNTERQAESGDVFTAPPR